MARLIYEPSAVPFDLRTYDTDRWVQTAIDADDDFIRHIPAEDRFDHWYVRHVTAPRFYRQALRDAVGQLAGDTYYSALFGGRTP